MKDDLRYVWPGWVVSAMPWMALLLIVAGALHVRIGLGRWPEFGASYNSAGWSLHQFMIVWTTIAAAVIAPPSGSCFFCFAARDSLRTSTQFRPRCSS